VYCAVCAYVYVNCERHLDRHSVLEQIIGQVKSYDNLIQPIVDAFKYLSPLTSDVLSYMLLRHCSDPEQVKLQQDGWLVVYVLF
jgi:Cdc6-like AAA superfamily ATPase